MKNKIICTMIFIFTGSIVMSQEELNIPSNKASDYLNFSISIGLTGNNNSKNTTESDKPGFNYSADISLTPRKTVGFFFNYASANLKGKNYDYENFRSSEFKTFKFTQFTLGPRIYSGSKKSFIDAGIGYYRINNDKVAGLTLGIGGKIAVSDNYAVAVTGRFNAADLSDNKYFFYSLSAGFEINNKGYDHTQDNANYRISVGALAGNYGEKFFGGGNKSFSAELTYDIGKRTALLINYIYSQAIYGYTNDLGNYINVSNTSQNEITGGVRFYLNGSNLRLFIEGMTGAYYISEDYDHNPGNYYFVSVSNSYFGLTFGGGVEFRIVDNLIGIVKADVSNHITGDSHSGVFGGLKYRL